MKLVQYKRLVSAGFAMTETEAIEVARRYARWRGWGMRVSERSRVVLLDRTWMEKAVPGLKIDQHPTWFIEFGFGILDGYKAHFRIDDTTRRVIKSDLPSVFSHLRWTPLLVLGLLIMPVFWLIDFVLDYKLPSCPECGQ